MPKRPPPEQPEPAPDGVFDSAAPPPPQAVLRAPDSPPPPPPMPPPVVPAAAAATGPWYTCGLGAGLLAQSPILFGLAVLLTYSAALGILAFLLLVLAGLLCQCSCSGLDCGCESCTDGCCSCGDGCDCGGCDCGGCGGCDCGCGGCGCATMEPTVAAVAGAVLSRRPSLAHHPDLPQFEADVVRIRGTRVCVGCLTVYPSFLAASALLLALQPAWPWLAMAASGLALAAAQAISSLGWARSRMAKVLVKASLGVGMALATIGLLDAPWPRLGRAAALAALLALAWLSAQPRKARIAAAAPCAAGHGSGAFSPPPR